MLGKWSRNGLVIKLTSARLQYLFLVWKVRHARLSYHSVRRNGSELPHFQDGQALGDPVNSESYGGGFGARIVEALGVRDLSVHKHFRDRSVDVDLELQSIGIVWGDRDYNVVDRYLMLH